MLRCKLLLNLFFILKKKKKETDFIKNYYSFESKEIFQVYLQYLNPFLNQRQYKFGLKLPNHFRTGSKMLQIVKFIKFTYL